MAEYIDEELKQNSDEIKKDYKSKSNLIKPVIEDDVLNNVLDSGNKVNSPDKELFKWFNSVGDGVIVTDLDFKIISMNHSAQLLTGWKNDDIKGKKIHECFKVIKDKSNSDKNIELNPDEKDIDFFNNKLFVSKNGIKNSFMVSSSPLQNSSGKTTNILLILKTKDRSQTVSFNNFYKYKHDNFVTITRGLLHDLNNYFTPLLANLSLLKYNTEKNDDNYDRITSCEMSCIKAIDFMQKLTFLCENSSLKKELTSISKVINTSVDLILSGTNIKCDYKINDDLKPVEVDKNKIVQALYNIVKIYRDKMTDGGTINVIVENFEKDNNEFLPLEDRDYIRVTIGDDNNSINLDEVEFNTEYRFDTKDNTDALGLTLAFNIIREHGGFFDIDSISEQGTKVFLYLPTLDEEVLFLDKENQDRTLSEDNAEKENKQLNVLVMDDNDFVSGSLAEMLVSLDCGVYIAKDGEEALKLYSEANNKNNSFDIAILDLTIPGGMGAQEIVKSLKAINSDVKLVVTSGSTDHPVMQNFKDHGFDSFIQKPFDFAELRSLMDGLMNYPTK